MLGNNVATTAELLTGHTFKCVFCSGEHFNYECRKAQSMSNDMKREKLKYMGCCYICTKPSGHSFKDCKLKVLCKICNGKHAVAMCTKSSAQSSVPNQTVQSTSAGIAYT